MKPLGQEQETDQASELFSLQMLSVNMRFRDRCPGTAIMGSSAPALPPLACTPSGVRSLHSARLAVK